MSRKEIKETDRFTAKTPDGRQIIIVQYTTFLEVSGTWIEGIKILKTSDGQPVNFHGEGKYELLNGTKLTRV